MTAYNLHASRYTDGATLQKAVGQQYHLGLSAGFFTLADGTTNQNVFYGYILEPDNTKSGGFKQRSDTASKDALINYSSGQLIDRDLAFFPRVTDGDFSGGGYQEVWIDTHKYFDSELDIRIPGYLRLRPQLQYPIKSGITAGAHFQTVAWNGDYWYSFGESNGNIYSANGNQTTAPTQSSIVSLDTDGSLLYAGTASALYSTPDGNSWTTVDSTINGTATQWWIINQGTNGFFAYYQSGSNLLYKIDLTKGVGQSAANQPQVPMGGNAVNIVDIVEYQTSIAILTTDVRGSGSDLWYFDGTNLTRIARIDGYTAQGMCNALGSLYIGLSAIGQNSSPILSKVDSGTFEVVARPGLPFPVANQSCLQPRASSQYVYWPLVNPSLTVNVAPPLLPAAPGGLIVQYDVLSGAVSHLNPFTPAVFSTNGGSLRAVAILGNSVGFVTQLSATTGMLIHESTAFPSATGANIFMPGSLTSSRIDFATPGINKRFRRIEVHHSPLNAAEQITVNAFVDVDPVALTVKSPTSAPIANATAINNIVGSTLTALTFGTDTIGKTVAFQLIMTSSFQAPGTGGLTTPTVFYVSIEVGGTWAWEVTLACTSKRQLLDGENYDQQGVTGKDLAYLLLLAYENGYTMTLYHRNGQSYQVAIESLELWNPSPLQPSQSQLVRDEEYLAHVILRQVS